MYAATDLMGMQCKSSQGSLLCAVSSFKRIDQAKRMDRTDGMIKLGSLVIGRWYASAPANPLPLEYRRELAFGVTRRSEDNTHASKPFQPSGGRYSKIRVAPTLLNQLEVF